MVLRTDSVSIQAHPHRKTLEDLFKNTRAYDVNAMTSIQCVLRYKGNGVHDEIIESDMEYLRKYYRILGIGIRDNVHPPEIYVNILRR